MSELINFRDFGGYKTRSGRVVKKNIFYRCGSYRDLTEEDREYLRSLNIQNLLDYRENHELDKDEYRETFAKKVHTLSASAHLNVLHQGNEDAFAVLSSDSMIDFYRKLPFDNPAYKNMFKVLQEDNATPYLHNCTAGKDRTGVATALILVLLDVHTKVVMAEYMLSMNAYEQIYSNEVRRLADSSRENELLHKIPGLVVMPTYLKAAFDAILERYGSYEAYFEKEYGLDEAAIQALRERYTE